MVIGRSGLNAAVKLKIRLGSQGMRLMREVLLVRWLEPNFASLLFKDDELSLVGDDAPINRINLEQLLPRGE